MSVSVQEKDFDQGEEYRRLCEDSPRTGAIVTFCGLVRDFDQGEGKGILLEYYPGMTERALGEIIDQAKKRWPIIQARIIHRVGQLDLSEQIVFVGVNSAHRQAAFSACEFIMDYLKTQAPFWKKAITNESDYWIEAKASDQAALQKWASQKNLSGKGDTNER